MDVFTAFVDITFRWLHVIAACLALGGAFFLRFVLPGAAGPLDTVGRDAALLRARRGYKLTVHPAILVFLVTGAYNAVRNWPIYTLRPGVMHGVFGVHVLLGLAVIGLLLWLLAGREPRRSYASGLRAAVVLMLLAVLAASWLKWLRDRTVRRRMDAANPAVVMPAAAPATTTNAGPAAGGGT